MFVEQRLYTFAPGKGGEFDRLYQAEARDVQERYLGAPIGYYYRGLSRCLLKLLRQAPKGEGYAARLWRSMA